MLNRIAAFWFDKTRDLIPNHVLSAEPEKLAEFRAHAGVLEKRALLARKLDAFPVEAIVRGYIVGSGWNSYQKSGEICGIRLPRGLTFADRLPEPIFTPDDQGRKGHDENMSFEQLAGQPGPGDGGADQVPVIGIVRRGQRLRPRAGDHHRRFQVRVRS